LVLDTFQRVFTGNENSSEDVGAFIAKLDKIIADYECCIMIVHHTGHGNSDRARGSSVIPASLDSEFKVEKDKNSTDDEMRIKFTQTLNKDSMNSANLAFKLVDDYVIVKGKKIHSAYLEKIEFNFEDEGGKKLNFSTKMVLNRIEADNACIEDEDARKEHTFTQADYKNEIIGGRNKFFSESTIKGAFRDLINANHIYDTETKDGCSPLYQLTILRNQSEFDKSDKSDN
jgi:RecA-family ATPase